VLSPISVYISLPELAELEISDWYEKRGPIGPEKGDHDILWAESLVIEGICLSISATILHFTNLKD
jgi:hypothetical protein